MKRYSPKPIVFAANGKVRSGYLAVAKKLLKANGTYYTYPIGAFVEFNDYGKVK